MNLHSTTRDLTHKRQNAGIGSTGATFQCDFCAKPRAILGRRLRMLCGARTWACVSCAGKGKA